MSKIMSKTMNKINKQIDDIKKIGLTFLETLKEKELTNIITMLNNSYYNLNISLLKDEEYDMIKDYIEKKYPNNNILKQIGAKITSKNKVKLPYFMGSLDKIKSFQNNVFNNWISKYNGSYIITPKIDGVSGLYISKNGKEYLMTRGDGYYGQNITHLIPYLKIPKMEENIVIRGEFIMFKNVFEEKYKDNFSNIRNLISGIINSKQLNNKINDIHFICYEIIEPEMKPSKQYEILLEKVSNYCVLNKEINVISLEKLTETLIKLKKELPYEIDGLVVTDNKIYKRTNENPKHSFAFKMLVEEQVMEAKVVDVIWNPSKDGYLKPQIQIEPIILNGVEINYTTGFNGSYIYKNKIGKGTILKIVRSGDVIPHITEVVTCSDTPLMPDKNIMSYKWNETNVDIILENKEDNLNVIEKNITLFFKGLKVEGLSTGIVNNLIKNKYDTIYKIINMKIEDFIEISGFKEKLSNKIYNNIQERLKNVSLIELMSSSNIFGRGISIKKIELIMEEYPNILFEEESQEKKKEKILKIKGFSTKTTDLFVNYIPDFLEFLKKINIHQFQNLKIINEKIDTNHTNNTSNIQNNELKSLQNKTILLTGFRDVHLSKILKNVGCKEGSKVSEKSTYLIIVKNDECLKDNNLSVKVKDGIKYNIPIMTYNNFINKYNIVF
jgi:NAD-dependent DNA ligase